MYLINTTGLASKMLISDLSSDSYFRYLIAGQILVTLIIYRSVTEYIELSGLLYYEVAIVLAITVFGIDKCYRINGGASGENFIERFIALSVPATVEANIFGYTLSWLIFNVAMWLNINVVLRLSTQFIFAISVLATVFFYYRVLSGFRIMNRQEARIVRASFLLSLT